MRHIVLQDNRCPEILASLDGSPLIDGCLPFCVQRSILAATLGRQAWLRRELKRPSERARV